MDGMMGNGVSCCLPTSDCQMTDYETDAAGRYWITAEGERIQVPPDKILQRADNPTGRGVTSLRHYKRASGRALFCQRLGRLI